MAIDTELSELSWRDYWAIAVRRRWYLIASFFGVGLLGLVVARVWPVRYRSEALVLVEEQKVPNQYVTPNVVANAEDRLQTVTEEVLSRARLQQLITQFDLYPQAQLNTSPEDLVNMMRKDIAIEPMNAPTGAGDPIAFRISYVAADNRVAREVVNELTSLFIGENQRARNEQSTNTTSFLENQLGEARQHLDETERRLNDFKMQYLGELPEQEQSNLQIMAGLEAQLSSGSTELDQLEQEKTYLESVKAGYAAIGLPPTPSSRSGNGSSGSSTLADLRAKLADLETRYTDRYPEVIETKEEIAHLEASQKRQTASQANSNETVAGVQAPAADGAPSGQIEIDSRVKALSLEIESRRKQMGSLRARIGAMEGRLNLTPIREQQLAEVTRDYQDAQVQYQSLLQKETQSQLATNLERRDLGEQFRILDPASLPDRPVAPNRVEIILGGWVLGFVAGIALAAAAEMTDTRLHGRRDLTRVTPLPLLTTVPILRTLRDEVRARRQPWTEAFALVLLVVVSLALGAYVLLG